MKAMWNDQVIAESDATIVIEGNHHFPPGSIDQDDFLQLEGHGELLRHRRRRRHEPGRSLVLPGTHERGSGD